MQAPTNPRMGGGGVYEGGYTGADQGVGMSPASPQQGCVVMLYGLDSGQLNCDKVFNLLCLYGNVVRVSKTAMMSLSKYSM